MARIIIRSDGNGGAIVHGSPPVQSLFFYFALLKVLSGKCTDISWEPTKEIDEETQKGK